MTSRHISFKIIKFVGMMKVTLIGAGNLATQLGKSLKKAGVIISQVYSRTEDSARTLAELLEAEWLTDIKALRDEADIYIFSVKDSVLCELISYLLATLPQAIHLMFGQNLQYDYIPD